MTDPADTNGNMFLSGSLARLYVRTATPIIFIMAMSGLLTVIDAFFLGIYVGADALTAVTLMFPVFMLMVALSTLVGNGMASVLARLLGAGDHRKAREVFVSAHGLSVIVCLILISLFLFTGNRMIETLADGSDSIAAMGYTYIAILIFCSPLGFILSVNSDALRCEGQMTFMAAVSLATSLANIAFNYVLIVVLDMGVAGSAIGTVLAQMLGIAAIAGFRIRGETPLGLRSLPLGLWVNRWPEFLALGAPQSLNFLGFSLGSGAIIMALQYFGGDNRAATVAAYGIITRVMTFIYLPMLGLNMSMQTITGNNFGARLWHRSDASLRLAVLLGLAYCAVVQFAFYLARNYIGFAFVDDTQTASEVARILPIATAVLFVAGPMMVLSGYFQAIGDARRAAILSLPRTYLFAIPMTFLLPVFCGETGIWLAGPAAEVVMLMLTAIVLYQAWSATGHRWGLLRHRFEPA